MFTTINLKVNPIGMLILARQFVFREADHVWCPYDMPLPHPKSERRQP
jgi:hypothetical protein